MSGNTTIQIPQAGRGDSAERAVRKGDSLNGRLDNHHAGLADMQTEWEMYAEEQWTCAVTAD